MSVCVCNPVDVFWTSGQLSPLCEGQAEGQQRAQLDGHCGPAEAEVSSCARGMGGGEGGGDVTNRNMDT